MELLINMQIEIMINIIAFLVVTIGEADDANC